LSLIAGSSIKLANLGCLKRVGLLPHRAINQLDFLCFSTGFHEFGFRRADLEVGKGKAVSKIYRQLEISAQSYYLIVAKELPVVQ